MAEICSFLPFVFIVKNSCMLYYIIYRLLTKCKVLSFGVVTECTYRWSENDSFFREDSFYDYFIIKTRVIWRMLKKDRMKAHFK